MVARLCLFLLVFSVCAGARAQAGFDEDAAERALRHQEPEWQALAPHLPDLATGTPAKLTEAADVLRARRMPDDALIYYRAAIRNGGDEALLLNRLGVTLLELKLPLQARAHFKRAVLLNGKDPQGWNNLGASEYVNGNLHGAVDDYKHAVKLDKKTAIFHSNLGTAYFDLKDFESSQKQYDIAMTLDRNVFARGETGGINAHVLSPADRGRFCFEMARLSARHRDDEGVMRWLAQASETGFDIRGEMREDSSFDAYRKDTRIAMLIHNAKAMHGGDVALDGPVPTLPPAD